MIERRIEEWKQRLIDLSRRNRLIYFQWTKSSSLSVSQPNAEEVFARLVKQEKPWKFWMPPPVEANEEYRQRKKDPEEQTLPLQGISNGLVCEIPGKQRPDRKEFERIFKNLYRRSYVDYQERGVRILYVAFGLLNWREIETSDIICSPLILCPVELKRENTHDSFVLSLTEEEIVLNPALQVKLRRDFNIDLPSIPEDWDKISLQAYLNSINQFVYPRGWSAELRTLIGLFSFHKLVMYQDLAANALSVKAHPVIRALEGEPIKGPPDDIPGERELDSIQKPEETFQILDADSSQQQCIQAALRGYSLVLQGPPGTGKSQTIANIVAEFIVRGRTVLFVSEKMAALEVVFKRLREAGLGEFCLELHSHKANKREVVGELKRCLYERLEPRQENLPSSIDFESLKQLRKSLNDYVLALHNERKPLGRNVRYVLSILAELNAVPLVPTMLNNPSHLSFGQMQEWEELVKRLATVWQVAEEKDNFPWLGCKENQFTLEIRNQWTFLLNQFAYATRQLMERSEIFSTDIGIETPSTLAEVEWLIQIGNHLAQSPGPEASWLRSNKLERIFDEAKKYRTLNDDYRKIRVILNKRYQDSFFLLPFQITDRLKAAWDSVAILLSPVPIAPVDMEGQSLLKQYQQLLEFVESTELLVKNCMHDAVELEGHLGVSTEKITLKHLRELAHLAILCNSEVKPEADWLDPIRLQQVRNLIVKIHLQYEGYRKRKYDLLTRYNENILSLNIDQFVEKFKKLKKEPLSISLDELHELIQYIILCYLSRSTTLLDLDNLIIEWHHDANKLSKLLGLPIDNITPECTHKLAQLAILCSSEVRPESDWLDSTCLQRVRSLLKKIRIEYEGYTKRRHGLLVNYDENILLFDVDQFVEEFNKLKERHLSVPLEKLCDWISLLRTLVAFFTVHLYAGYILNFTETKNPFCVLHALTLFLLQSWQTC